VYLYLAKYLGEPFTIGGEGVTLMWETPSLPRIRWAGTLKTTVFLLVPSPKARRWILEN
jgi:hypothetical protein